MGTEFLNSAITSCLIELEHSILFLLVFINGCPN